MQTCIQVINPKCPWINRAEHKVCAKCVFPHTSVMTLARRMPKVQAYELPFRA